MDLLVSSLEKWASMRGWLVSRMDLLASSLVTLGSTQETWVNNLEMLASSWVTWENIAVKMDYDHSLG
jgi:hypothetical protein